MTTYTRRATQRAQLIADGRKALELIQARPIADVLLVVGGSRARLYRAMEAARLADELERADMTEAGIDPLLV